MEETADRSIIMRFVRDVLGCGCSDEVFSYIEAKEDVVVRGGMKISKRINIGNRLLIYVLVQDSAANLESIPEIFRIGKEDRDSGGFNRFRLVVATDGGNADPEAEALMACVGPHDDRMHIHVVEGAAVTRLNGAGPL
jgi:hypothetical protein